MIVKDYRNVMILAGEASGDIYGAHLTMAIKVIAPGTKFFGIGGPEMARAGVDIVYQSADMAVVGLTELIPKGKYILKALSGIKNTLKINPPSLLILIDYPGFNLNVAKKAHSLGIPILYYVPPQIWAWWQKRASKLAERVDKIAVILPFEENFYKQYGLNVEYVGHPLLDIPLPEGNKVDILKKLGIDINRGPIIGLLPGSRKEEVEKLLPIMAGAAEFISHYYPKLYCVLPLASTVEEDMVRGYVKNMRIDVTITKADTKSILSITDLAFIASGTATLEAAIMETPMVVSYKVSFISYLLGRMLIKVSSIGLVNLVAGKNIVPEFIQDKATAQNLGEQGLSILKNDMIKEGMKRELKIVKKKLGKGGASAKTANIAAAMMGLL